MIDWSEFIVTEMNEAAVNALLSKYIVTKRRNITIVNVASKVLTNAPDIQAYNDQLKTAQQQLINDDYSGIIGLLEQDISDFQKKRAEFQQKIESNPDFYYHQDYAEKKDIVLIGERALACIEKSGDSQAFAWAKERVEKDRQEMYLTDKGQDIIDRDHFAQLEGYHNYLKVIALNPKGKHPLPPDVGKRPPRPPPRR